MPAGAIEADDINRRRPLARVNQLANAQHGGISRNVLGLGPRTRIDWVEVRWPQPSGLVERFTDLPIDRYVVLREGQGKPQT